MLLIGRPHGTDVGGAKNALVVRLRVRAAHGALRVFRFAAKPEPAAVPSLSQPRGLRRHRTPRRLRRKDRMDPGAPDVSPASVRKVFAPTRLRRIPRLA